MKARHKAGTLLRTVADDRYYFDVTFLLLLTAGAVIVLSVPVLNETVLRVIVTIPLILFTPGYALISLLFPSKEQISALERILLAFGMSFVIAALVGLILNYTPWGIRLEPVSAAMICFSWFALMFAYYRRALLDPEVRFAVSFRHIADSLKSGIRGGFGTGNNAAISRLLVLSILLAIATTALVMAIPKQGEHFSEFYILGENGEAFSYPQKVIANEPQQMKIGIANHEYRDVDYIIEVYAVNQNTDVVANITAINAMVLLDRFSLSLTSDQVLERSYTCTLDGDGFNRIDFLLFKDGVPSDEVSGMERIAASYRNLHIWVDVAS